MDHDFWCSDLEFESYPELMSGNGRESSVDATAADGDGAGCRNPLRETLDSHAKPLGSDQFFEQVLPREGDFLHEGPFLSEDSLQRLLLSVSSPRTHGESQLSEEKSTPDKRRSGQSGKSNKAAQGDILEDPESFVGTQTDAHGDNTVSLRDVLALALPRVDPYSRQRLLELHGLLRKGSLDVYGFISELRRVIGSRMLRELATELETTQHDFLECERTLGAHKTQESFIEPSQQNAMESVEEISLLEPATMAGTEVSSSESTPLSTSQSASTSKPKKRAWTRLEHYIFLKAMQIYGRGKWKYIADVLPGRTPNQVASHAKKFFLRQRKSLKDKRMRSIHDLVLSSPEMREVERALETGAIETPGFNLAALGIVRKVQSVFRRPAPSHHDGSLSGWETALPGISRRAEYTSAPMYPSADYAGTNAHMGDPMTRSCDLRLRRLEYTAHLLRQTISTMRAQACGTLVDPRGS